MANPADLSNTIRALIPKITGINMIGGTINYLLAEGDSLTQNEIDLFDAEVVIWQAQTEAQKIKSEALIQAKALVIDINQALQAIDLISTVNLSVNPFVVYDTDGTTPLLTIPNDADWTAFTNAQVKVAVRTLSILFALTLQADIAQKAGYLDIMKYIKSELNNP